MKYDAEVRVTCNSDSAAKMRAAIKRQLRGLTKGPVKVTIKVVKHVSAAQRMERWAESVGRF